MYTESLIDPIIQSRPFVLFVKPFVLFGKIGRSVRISHRNKNVNHMSYPFKRLLLRLTGKKGFGPGGPSRVPEQSCFSNPHEERVSCCLDNPKSSGRAC